MRCNRFAPQLLTSLLILASAPGAATTYVMITDEELLAQADAVVRGSIVALADDPAGALPATTYLLEIDEAIAGYVPASSLEVRVSGGLDEVGDSWVVWGAPRFREGEQLLLFLEESEDGDWQVLHSSLGAFREVNTPQGRFVTRDLGSAHELVRVADPLASARARSHQPRDLAGFTAWMRSRAAGVGSEADYFVESIPAPSSVLKYQLIGSGTQSPPNGCGATGGHPIRVFDFDRGSAFRFDAHASGQPGIAGGGFSQLKSAMQAWNRDSGSNINLTYTGTTTDTPNAGSTRQTVLWNDPRNEIPGSFDGGGILAQTITGFRCDLDPFANGHAHPIGGALVVTQDGLERFLADNSKAEAALEEILGHELGHAIGFGHSCESRCSGAAGDALMASRIHADGRGARLASDDKAGAAFLYPAPADESGSPDPDPTDGGGSSGGSSSKKPARPTNLSVPEVTTSRITLEWSDRSANEQDFVIERRSPTGEWTVISTAPANSKSKSLTGLSQATYHVFRVSARNSNGSSYSNEVGVTTKAHPGSCLADAQTVCLNSNRFRVTIDFLTKQNQAGKAKGKRYSSDTGLFSFFSTSNVELTVKVLDGCSWGHYWVFAAGMTNLETVITVSDMKNGSTRSYVNPQGSAFPPIQDTAAFTCQ